MKIHSGRNIDVELETKQSLLKMRRSGILNRDLREDCCVGRPGQQLPEG